jgi:hypothetical protein
MDLDDDLRSPFAFDPLPFHHWRMMKTARQRCPFYVTEYVKARALFFIIAYRAVHDADDEIDRSNSRRASFMVSSFYPDSMELFYPGRVGEEQGGELRTGFSVRKLRWSISAR